LLSVHEHFAATGGERCEGAVSAQEFLFVDVHMGDFDEESVTAGRAWLDNCRAVYGVRHDVTLNAYYDVIYEASMAGMLDVEQELRDRLRADLRRATGVDPGGWVNPGVCDVMYLAAGDIAGAARRHARQLRARTPVGGDQAPASAYSNIEHEFPQLDLNLLIWQGLEASIKNVAAPLPSEHPHVEAQVLAQAARNLALARDHMHSVWLTL
jgi:hypothetical protein